MRSRSVVAGYVLVVVLAATFAFLFIRAFEVRGPVWDGGWQLNVDEVTTSSTPASTLYGRLDDFAQPNGVDIVRYVIDSERPETRRHFFVADGGGEGAAWLQDGYEDADPGLTTTVDRITELGDLDPRGNYLVDGTEADARRVLALIVEAGWAGEEHPFPPASEIGSYSEFGDLQRAFGVCILAILVLIGSGTVLRGRAHGIQRLAGRSNGRILRDEVIALSAPVTAISGVVGAALIGAAQL